MALSLSGCAIPNCGKGDAMKKAVFLFDTTGYAAQPFTEAGWETYIIDILNVEEYAINPRATHTLSYDILAEEAAIIELCEGAEFVFGFPPCTDMAVSGAAHFSRKKAADPLFQDKAVVLARSVERIATAAGVPWALENPISVLATKWRKPDFIFDPWHFGGYLPENDKHPDYSTYIAPRDAYPKKTCLWKSPDFKLPLKKPVKRPSGYSTQHTKLGGKSEKTKRIRSASPRGFFRALYEVYK